MKNTKLLGCALVGAALTLNVATAQSLSPIEELGKALFFDTNLSTPPGQSCAACHGPGVGFTGPIEAVNAGGAVYPGAVHTRFGNRKPPAAAYGGASPLLQVEGGDEDATMFGGMFWDGRATGWTLGDPLTEQALGPFLNPLEQNNPDATQVISKVAESSYARLFEQVWGTGSLADVPSAYEKVGRSIAAYERSKEVSAFTSKYDYYLKGQVKLSRQEMRGLRLYEGKAMCAACHPSQATKNGPPPQFTDFTYDNLGVPRNPLNPFYNAPSSVNPAGSAWVDTGLGGFLQNAGFPPEVYEAQLGKQKVPTLRNVDKRPNSGFVKAYTHNGVFKSLEEIVHFYNTRDVAPWPPPEVPMNVNTDELGNLGLTAQEEADVVAFLKTLSDGYQPAR